MLTHFKERIRDEENIEITETKVKIGCFKALKEILRQNILEKEKRQDLRKLDQVRPLFVET
jgi:polyribonucleotide nucleotidyltransferase